MSGIIVKESAPVRERLIQAMKEVFGTDRRRIDHALDVLRYARELRAEEGGSELVVEAAAILHDIGIHEAERKHGSSAGRYQEIEGPPIAETIMTGIGIGEPSLSHVCRIVANHHSARDINTLEFRIIWDADRLVNFPEEHGQNTREKRETLIDRIFKTETGKQKAYQLFLEEKKEKER